MQRDALTGEQRQRIVRELCVNCTEVDPERSGELPGLEFEAIPLAVRMQASGYSRLWKRESFGGIEVDLAARHLPAIEDQLEYRKSASGIRFAEKLLVGILGDARSIQRSEVHRVPLIA